MPTINWVSRRDPDRTLCNIEANLNFIGSETFDWLIIYDKHKSRHL